MLVSIVKVLKLRKRSSLCRYVHMFFFLLPGAGKVREGVALRTPEVFR